MASHMQVILARDVPNLGRVGDLVGVRAGYARNFLVPKGMALPASPKRVTHFEHQRKVVEHRRRLLKAESQGKAKELAAVQLSLTARVGDQGKLFGSITTRDIARALADKGYVIDHRDVKLENPIRTLGLHTIDLRLEADVTAQVKLVVAPEVVASNEDDQDDDQDDAAPAAAAPAEDAEA